MNIYYFKQKIFSSRFHIFCFPTVLNYHPCGRMEIQEEKKHVKKILFSDFNGTFHNTNNANNKIK